jgi:YD repeat-containing protein
MVYTAYDLMGRATNTWGATYPVAYAYDAFGRLTAMTTRRADSGPGDTTQWRYDLVTGLLTNKLYADGKGPAYAYDAMGRLTRRTWARGVATDYAYDELGQLTGIDYADSTPDVVFDYDRLGRQTLISDGLGVRTNVYDAATLALTEERLPDGSVLTRARGRPSALGLGPDYAVSYGDDGLGRLTRRTWARGVATDYAYIQGSGLLADWASNGGTSFTRAFELSHC